MRALADIDRDLRLACIGVLLALERLDMPRAVDGVVEYPRFLRCSPFRVVQVRLRTDMIAPSLPVCNCW